MRFLPIENITYKTSLNPSELISSIREQVEPKKTFRLVGLFGSKNYKPYEGEVLGYTFNISRIIGYRNSFQPTISGIIEEDYSGSVIYVKMRLLSFVLVFLSIWFGTVYLASIAAIFSTIHSGSFEPWTLVPFSMLFFAYVLTMVAFKVESTKSKKYLAELFYAKIEQQ